jgi:hypothetical protein
MITSETLAIVRDVRVALLLVFARLLRVVLEAGCLEEDATVDELLVEVLTVGLRPRRRGGPNSCWARRRGGPKSCWVRRRGGPKAADGKGMSTIRPCMVDLTLRTLTQPGRGLGCHTLERDCKLVRDRMQHGRCLNTRGFVKPVG